MVEKELSITSLYKTENMERKKSHSKQSGRWKGNLQIKDGNLNICIYVAFMTWYTEVKRVYLCTNKDLSDQILCHVTFKVLPLGVTTLSPMILPSLEA
jgi:hypothetical protein